MSYVRFRVGEHRSGAERSVAGVATVAEGAGGLPIEGRSVPALEPPAGPRKSQSVASVADVAAPQVGSARCATYQFRRSEAATPATPATLRIKAEDDTILEAYARLLSGAARDCSRGIELVQNFLHRNHANARCLGWTDVELFGCHLDQTLAVVRYDAMGAVTLSALMGWPTSAVLADRIQFVNGLSFVRGATCPCAAKVWEARPIAAAA